MHDNWIKRHCKFTKHFDDVMPDITQVECVRAGLVGFKHRGDRARHLRKIQLGELNECLIVYTKVQEAICGRDSDDVTKILEA